MAVTQAAPQQMGGHASDLVNALATEIIDYIAAAPKRVRDNEMRTGLLIRESDAREALIEEVAAKIRALNFPGTRPGYREPGSVEVDPAYKPVRP